MTPTDHDVLISLRDYVDQRFSDLERLREAERDSYLVRVSAIDRAVVIAKEVNDVRFAALNNIREQLRENEGRFASRETVDYNSKRITVLEQAAAEAHGSSIGRASLIILGLITSLGAIVTIVHMFSGK